MSANCQPLEFRVVSAALAFTLCLATIVPAVAQAVPPPPPPPDVLARIAADCRAPPRETIPLAMSQVQPPRAPAQLHISSAIRLMPPPGAHLGTIVGLTRTWRGSIVAATDRGYWIRVPSERDERLAPRSGPVAVSIRDLAESPEHMTFGALSGGAGYDDVVVLLAVAGQPALLLYPVGACFPSAPRWPGPTVPPGQSIFRLEPATNGPPGHILVRFADGSVRERSILDFETGRGELSAVAPPVRAATSSARIELAEGCDELTFHRQQSGTLVETSCSPGFLSSLGEMWRRPQRSHRQPLPIAATRIVGRIEAPVVAVSEAQFAWSRHVADPVPRGDRSNPGQTCSFLLAAQEGADAPIFIYVLQPYCAYYPQDPSGAPFPPPPPP